MTLYIKNMVCRRCILTVAQVLDKNGISPVSVTLGEITLAEALRPEQTMSLRAALEVVGGLYLQYHRLTHCGRRVLSFYRFFARSHDCRGSHGVEVR